MGYVHDQDDPWLQPVDGKSEKFIEADHHPVDGLVSKGAKDFARRRILDVLYGRRVQAAQLAREVKRFASYPYIGADTQRGFRFAGATQ